MIGWMRRVQGEGRSSKAIYESKFLDRLLKSGLDEGEFKIRGGFVVKNFDRLAVDVDQIKNLRQLILDLAVRGRLVEQDSE